MSIACNQPFHIADYNRHSLQGTAPAATNEAQPDAADGEGGALKKTTRWSLNPMNSDERMQLEPLKIPPPKAVELDPAVVSSHVCVPRLF